MTYVMICVMTVKYVMRYVVIQGAPCRILSEMCRRFSSCLVCVGLLSDTLDSGEWWAMISCSTLQLLLALYWFSARGIFTIHYKLYTICYTLYTFCYTLYKYNAHSTLHHYKSLTTLHITHHMTHTQINCFTV